LSLRRAQVRTELTLIREFVLKSYLRDAERPARADINKALYETGRQLRVFLDRTADLGSLPDWPVADSAEIENLSPYHIFITLPW
jgi:hypothetical protein